MKKLFKTLIILQFLLFILVGCSFFKPVVFNDLEVGKNFLISRDGYYKKLPSNYCINVELRKKASLFKVPDEQLNSEWNLSLNDSDVVVEGHFIKGFFTSEYLVLCEEKENDDVDYAVFSFGNGQLRYYKTPDEVYAFLDIDSVQWFTLCNTNREINYIN